jgi:hypothetical protein
MTKEEWERRERHRKVCTSLYCTYI